MVTVLMARHPRLLGHRRAHRPERSSRAQLNEHRAEMNRAILDEGGTVMQFVGDAVMACFGAPVPLDDHADRACARPRRDARRQAELERAVGRARARRRSGSASGCRPARSPPRCSAPRSGVEYTLVGDTVNLAQRLQDLARPAGPHRAQRGDLRGAARRRPTCEPLDETTVKGAAARRCARTASTCSTGHGTRELAVRSIMTDESPIAWWRRTGCARRSSPRARRCARCGASTSR